MVYNLEEVKKLIEEQAGKEGKRCDTNAILETGDKIICKLKNTFEINEYDKQGNFIRKHSISTLPKPLQDKLMKKILNTEEVLEKVIKANDLENIIDITDLELIKTTDPVLLLIKDKSNKVQKTGVPLNENIVGDIFYDWEKDKWEHFSYIDKNYKKL